MTAGIDLALSLVEADLGGPKAREIARAMVLHHRRAGGQLQHSAELEIGGKTTRIAEIEGQYMGLLKFTPAAWGAVEKMLSALDGATRDRLDMTGLLRRLLSGDHLVINTFATEGQWGEIDNPDDIKVYEEMVKAGELVLEDVRTASGRNPSL